MGLRFFRRVKLAPGITLNLSKRGGSVSFGPRGAKYTIGTRGQRATVGLPGTGLFYTKKLGAGKRAGGPAAKGAKTSTLSLSFFERLLTPDNEEALIDGCRELALGNDAAALSHFRQATHLADGAYMAGILALQQGDFDAAEEALQRARSAPELGCYFDKYGIDAALTLPITEEINAHVVPGHVAVLLALVEVYQAQERWSDTEACLAELMTLAPDDAVIKLSMAEVLMEPARVDPERCRQVVELASDISNDSDVHAALMLYKGEALHQLNLLSAARETLTAALRRKKGRSPELLRALKYERALVYEAMGNAAKARAEMEQIYADSPTYEDVATRLSV